MVSQCPPATPEDPSWDLLREREAEETVNTLANAAPAAPVPKDAVALPVYEAVMVPAVSESVAVGNTPKLYRLWRKQPCPISRPPPPGHADIVAGIGARAIAIEAVAPLVDLEEDARRVHIHYTHVRNKNPQDKQPESFSREGFWRHICRVYREVYPDAANLSGSILLFGCVAKELHAPDPVTNIRHEHHHAPTCCSKRHMWKPIAECSHKKYGVKLDAKCHTGYASMYSYIASATNKKALSELDADKYMSPEHPKGEDLRRLLKAGAVAATALSARRKSSSAVNLAGRHDEEPKTKRIRCGDVYGMVVKSNVRSTLDMQVLANSQAAEGDERLAEFCTSQGEEKLSELIKSALSVVEAPTVSRRICTSVFFQPKHTFRREFVTRPQTDSVQTVGRAHPHTPGTADRALSCPL